MSLENSSSTNSPTPADDKRAASEDCLTCGSCTCNASCHDSRSNLQCFNWLSDIPGNDTECDIVEVHFKNTRKGYYRNSAHLPLQEGDMVAVEANPGHDIGRVSMVGRLVKPQMKKARLRSDAQILRVFRKAKPADIERYEAAKSREADTMIRSRQIAKDLNLKMKIGDVEYQGDGNKAIFYYIADERVDFRQLIKVLADTFKIRVEMKQIGARQEAGRIGGIGPCGRPLCCTSWMTNFVSVSTSAARFQDISLNPQKLAGQCAKLKCCINFEVDAYVEASKKMPPRNVTLEIETATYHQFKTDLFKHEVTYSTEKNQPANLVVISVERAFEVIGLNKRGEKPKHLNPDGDSPRKEKPAFGDLLDQDSINRFDKKKKKKNKGKKKDKDNTPKEGNGANDNAAKPHNRQPKQGGKTNGSDSEGKRHGNAKRSPKPAVQDSGEPKNGNKNDASQHTKGRQQNQPNAPHN